MSFTVGDRVYSSTGQSGVITTDHNGHKVVKMVHGTGQHGTEICTWDMTPDEMVWRKEPWFHIDASTKLRIVYETDLAVMRSMGVSGLKEWAHLHYDERKDMETALPLDHHSVIGFKELRLAVLSAVKKAIEFA